MTHCWNHSYAATPQTLPCPDSSNNGCLGGGVFHFSVSLIISEMNMLSRPSANEVANICVASETPVAPWLCHCCRFFGIDGEWLCNLPPSSFFAAFFTLPPGPCSFLPPPGVTTTRPVSKDDLCYHQRPSKCIYSPTRLPGWSATLPCLYGDTRRLTSTGARHEDDRKRRAVTF